MPLAPLQDHELGMARREPGGDRQAHDPGADDGERRVGHRAMIAGRPRRWRPGGLPPPAQRSAARQSTLSRWPSPLRSRDRCCSSSFCCVSPSRSSRRCSRSRTDAMPSIRSGSAPPRGPSASPTTRWRRPSPTRPTATASASSRAGSRSSSRSRSSPPAGSGSSSHGRARARPASVSAADRDRPRLLRDPRSRERAAGAAVRPLLDLPHRAEARLQPPDAARLLPGPCSRACARRRARRSRCSRRSLWVMARMGPSWWLWAWALLAGFNLLAAWIYPSLLAPLFNRFTPLSEGELRDEILALAGRVGFRAGGIFVMDASRRTAHGNAYFTGLFGQKRIVLFDTLARSDGVPRGRRGARARARPLQAPPRALGDRPERRDERRPLLRAEPAAAARALLRGFLAGAHLLRRARRLRALVRARELPAAAARERPVAQARVRGRSLRAPRRGEPRRPRRGAPQAARARAVCCPSRTRSTRASTTPTRRCSSACARWVRSRVPRAWPVPTDRAGARADRRCGRGARARRPPGSRRAA